MSKTGSQTSIAKSSGNLVGIPIEESIAAFKEELIKIGIFDAERMDDHFLTRFLKARKFKLADCIKMLSDSEKWRKEYDVKGVVEAFAFPEGDEIHKIYRRYHHKTDKLGRPVYFEQFKDLDLKRMFSLTTEERFLKHHVREYEKFIEYKLAACSKKAGKHLDQGFTVLDLQGIPLSQFGNVKKLVGDLSKISGDNYPETLGILFVINAPMLFTAVWTVVKAMLDEVTVKKIHILGSSYKEKLLEWVEPENLPVQYGGKCTCNGAGCDNIDVGPWNDGTVEGYPNLKWEFAFRDNSKHISPTVQKLKLVEQTAGSQVASS